jgi:hypothetical protein
LAVDPVPAVGVLDCDNAEEVVMVVVTVVAALVTVVY